MPIKCAKTMLEYVNMLFDFEKEMGSEILCASSFLASHLFDENSVLRFFERDFSNDVSKKITRFLMERKYFVNNSLPFSHRYELYESTSIINFLTGGVVHNQSPDYRVTPSAIINALSRMQEMLVQNENYKVSFTGEVLPFVFLVKDKSRAIFDIKENYNYQGIQGILFIDEVDFFKNLKQDFFRVWNSKYTLNNRKEILIFLSEVIDSWNRNKEPNLGILPKMREEGLEEIEGPLTT